MSSGNALNPLVPPADLLLAVLSCFLRENFLDETVLQTMILPSCSNLSCMWPASVFHYSRIAKRHVGLLNTFTFAWADLQCLFKAWVAVSPVLKETLAATCLWAVAPTRDALDLLCANTVCNCSICRQYLVEIAPRAQYCACVVPSVLVRFCWISWKIVSTNMPVFLTSDGPA